MVTGRKRIFISFAIEDEYARTFLVGQGRNARSPFEFVDMSLKQPFDQRWKSQCRTRIKGCHGVVAPLSRNTSRATGARWEMWCANDEGRPMIGVHISRDKKGAIPPELQGKRVIEWSWDGIARFINTL